MQHTIAAAFQENALVLVVEFVESQRARDQIQIPELLAVKPRQPLEIIVDLFLVCFLRIADHIVADRQPFLRLDIARKLLRLHADQRALVAELREIQSQHLLDALEKLCALDHREHIRQRDNIVKFLHTQAQHRFLEHVLIFLQRAQRLIRRVQQHADILEHILRRALVKRDHAPALRNTDNERPCLARRLLRRAMADPRL